MCFSGHGSFSNNSKLNSVVGHLLHSSILVPYHGWYASASGGIAFLIFFRVKYVFYPSNILPFGFSAYKNIIRF